MLDRTATALALDPSLDLAHLARMRVYYHFGLFDEARREGRLALTRPDVRAQASLASIEAALGMRDAARARVADILRGSGLDHHVAYSIGAALVQLGEVNAGLDWLERTADSGFPCYPWYERDTLLDPLRRHPGFVRLLSRLRDRQNQARRLAG